MFEKASKGVYRMSKKSYSEPMIEVVPLVASEAVLANCKCIGPQVDGPPAGWCSGYEVMSCSTVGS
jgi:hypothetical protein